MQFRATLPLGGGFGVLGAEHESIDVWVGAYRLETEKALTSDGAPSDGRPVTSA